MKSTFFLILIIILVTGCTRTAVVKSHGISYLEKREKLIIVNKSNKNDTVKLLGQPATKGISDENLWIYIERTTTRGKLTKLGRNYLAKNNVLVLEFNKFGVLSKKEFFDKDDMNKLKFAKNVTVNDIKKENFIYSFLSSIRQKMNVKKNKPKD
tara:strand:+ start:406 stop:867 length:462 start_codon:yes stop_codon:yes gene_type:complete